MVPFEGTHLTGVGALVAEYLGKWVSQVGGGEIYLFSTRA